MERLPIFPLLLPAPVIFVIVGPTLVLNAGLSGKGTQIRYNNAVKSMPPKKQVTSGIKPTHKNRVNSS